LVKHFKDASGSAANTWHATIPVISDPSTSLVELLFRGGGFSCFKPDKGVWQFYVKYRDREFQIRDWKGVSWTIDTLNLSDLKAAYSLKGAVVAGCYSLKNRLDTRIRQQVKIDNFYMKNSYPEIRRLYDFSRGRLEKSLRKKKVSTKSKEISRTPTKSRASKTEIPVTRNLEFEIAWAKAIRRFGDISHNAAAMVIFYYSFVEMLLDILFAFKTNRGMNYQSFHELTFDERFKHVLPVSERPLNKLYEDLIAIKRSVRDPIVHGFNSEQTLSVMVKDIGLIPVSSRPNNFLETYFFPIKEASARKILEVFTSFDKWTTKTRCTQYAVIYGKQGALIPFGGNWLSELRSRMDELSPSDFALSLAQDADYYGDSTNL
jgi:hypothetical protein